VTLRDRIVKAERGSWGESPNADLPRPKIVVRLRVFGRAGDRDPDAPCDEFTPGEPSGSCKTDGHYLCHECEHCELCEGCRQIEARCECVDCLRCGELERECVCPVGEVDIVEMYS
jgi:hypothetical protein